MHIGSCSCILEDVHQGLYEVDCACSALFFAVENNKKLCIYGMYQYQCHWWKVLCLPHNSFIRMNRSTNCCYSKQAVESRDTKFACNAVQLLHDDHAESVHK